MSDRRSANRIDTGRVIPAHRVVHEDDRGCRVGLDDAQDIVGVAEDLHIKTWDMEHFAACRENVVEDCHLQGHLVPLLLLAHLASQTPNIVTEHRRSVSAPPPALLVNPW